MTTCPTCHQPATRRDGFDRRGRQRFAGSPCHRDFTHASSGAFSGYRWPPDVIITAVRWYLSYPLSARQVAELLAERGIDRMMGRCPDGEIPPDKTAKGRACRIQTASTVLQNS
jgi:transposase-like protein